MIGLEGERLAQGLDGAAEVALVEQVLAELEGQIEAAAIGLLGLVEDHRRGLLLELVALLAIDLGQLDGGQGVVDVEAPCLLEGGPGLLVVALHLVQGAPHGLVHVLEARGHRLTGQGLELGQGHHRDVVLQERGDEQQARRDVGRVVLEHGAVDRHRIGPLEGQQDAGALLIEDPVGAQGVVDLADLEPALVALGQVVVGARIVGEALGVAFEHVAGPAEVLALHRRDPVLELAGPCGEGRQNAAGDAEGDEGVTQLVHFLGTPHVKAVCASGIPVGRSGQTKGSPARRG
ncbi:hypothetical protein D3C86_1206920 [compost metagenome]